MQTISPTCDMSSIGRLCELLQTSPNMIDRACQAAGVVPSLRLNGIAYYNDLAVSEIRKALSDQKGTT